MRDLDVPLDVGHVGGARRHDDGADRRVQAVAYGAA